MTTILAVNGFARIGRRLERGPGHGMMLLRRLIRSDEVELCSRTLVFPVLGTSRRVPWAPPDLADTRRTEPGCSVSYNSSRPGGVVIGLGPGPAARRRFTGRECAARNAAAPVSCRCASTQPGLVRSDETPAQHHPVAGPVFRPPPDARETVDGEDRGHELILFAQLGIAGHRVPWSWQVLWLAGSARGHRPRGLARCRVRLPRRQRRWQDHVDPAAARVGEADRWEPARPRS